MSKVKKLSLSLISQLFNIIVTGLVGIIVVPIIIYFLGQENYGVLEIILSLMFINFFFELGLGSTLLRFIPVYEKEGIKTLNSFLWTYLYIKMMLSVIAAIIVLVIGRYFNLFFNIGQADTVLVKHAVYIFALGIFITNIATYFSNILKGFQRFDLAIIPNIIAQLFFLVLLYIFKQKGVKNVDILFIVFLMFIIQPLIRILISILFLKKTVPYVKFTPVNPQKRFLTESQQFLKGMSFIALISQLSIRVPKMILGILLNPVSVSYWGISDRLLSPFKNINSSFIRPLLPLASSMNFDEKLKINGLLIKLNKFHFFLIGGLSCFVLYYIQPFIEIWLGDDYIYVVKLVRLNFIPFIIPNASVLLMFYYAKGKTKLGQYFAFLNTVLGLILGSLLALRFDALGFAIGLVIPVIITSFISFYFLCQEFNLSFWSIFKESYLMLYIVISLTMIFMCFLTRIIHNSNFFELLLSIIICFVFYCLLSIITLKKEEKKFYKNLVRSLLKK